VTQPLNISIDNILKTSELINFLNVARNFCSLIEATQTVRPKEFLLAIQEQLLSLYSHGRNIPKVDLEEDSDIEVEIAVTDYRNITSLIGDKIPFQYYWHVFDPIDDMDTDPVCGDLIDDLSDIYKDLKNSLFLFDSRNIKVKGEAIWKFKFDFDSHWSNHCANAINVIHYFLQKDNDFHT
jgi:hypothetical protein